MFIPVGHDIDGLRRWPVVTFAIIALCTVVFVADRAGRQVDPEAAGSRFRAAAEYYVEHPELEAHPLLRRWIDAVSAEDPEMRDQIRGRLDDPDAETTPLQDIRQAKLDLIEDVWGRPFFVAFYLAAGLVSAGLFVLQYPDRALPLIGASGAVAGVLGAMLVRHPQTRIRILWLWGFVVRHFSTPAWVVLPAWVGSELVWAWVMDSADPGSGGGGVAHWVHVYGFVFGVVVAGAVKTRGLERMLAPHDRTERGHAVLRAVEHALARDRRAEAWQLLEGHVARTPADHDAALAYWDLAKTLGRPRGAVPVLSRVVRAELLAGDPAAAIAHWNDLRAAVPDAAPEIELAARLASALGDLGHTVEASELVRDAVARVAVTTPAGALVELLRAARFAEAAVTTEVEARALAHPGLPLGVRRALTNGSAAEIVATTIASGGADSLVGSR